MKFSHFSLSILIVPIHDSFKKKKKNYEKGLLSIASSYAVVQRHLKNKRYCYHMQRASNTASQIFLLILSCCRRCLGSLHGKFLSCPFIDFKGMSCSWQCQWGVLFSLSVDDDDGL